jgi:replicative DNA helicase
MKSEALPWSKELEIAVLCECVINPGSAEEICQLLKPEHFYSEAHKVIFRRIVDLGKKGQSVDMPNLWERLRAEGEIEKAGGDVYVASLTDFANSSVDYHSDCMILKRYAMRRALAKTGLALHQRAMAALDDPGEISQGVIGQLQQLGAELLSDSSTTSERDNALEMRASLETASPSRVVTGIPKLDEDLGGFRAGELITVAAETGVGKTVFARQIRRESCARGVHGLYCSGEMNGEQLSAREAAARTGIPQSKFRNPWKMERDELRRVLDFASMECDKCALLSANLSVSRITSAALEIRRRGCLGFIVIDYDELVEGHGATELEKQTSVVRTSKSLAMSLKVPVILLSQLRKLQQGERADKPLIDRMYGAGAKKKDSSSILFIDRPSVRNLEGDEAAATIFVVKNREGKVGHLPCQFQISRMQFHADEGGAIP